jgi:myo-inositol-1(or 4)-monophosphatase
MPEIQDRDSPLLMTASLTPSELQLLESFLVELASLSAAQIMPWFCNPKLSIEQKADRTPVTEADKAAERVIRDRIVKRFPAHGIIGEEFGSNQEAAEFLWMIDPIDGTKSFVAGNAQFGTLIALLHNQKPVLSCIHFPATQQLIIGNGTTAQLNGHPIQCRKIKHLSEAILLTTDLDNPCIHQSAEGWNKLKGSVKKTYTWGDCYGYYLAASGGADIMCDPVLNPYDFIPLLPILEGAGLCFSDWNGRPMTLQSTSLVTAHPNLHPQIIELLNS